MAQLPRALWEIARVQESVLGRDQLLATMTAGALDAQVAAGRWQRPAPSVYVLHNGPLSVAQQWWVASLAVGPLAGRTALASWGLQGWPSDHVEVLVRRGEHPHRPRGFPLLVHESRRFGDVDIHPARQPRRVRVERAAIDAAAWTRQPRAACGLLASIVQQRLTSASRLATCLSAAGAVRHAGLLRIVLQDIEGGAQAMTEVDLGRICRRYGLLLERQVVRRDGQGRRRFVDARVKAPGGRSVLVEVDGALHLVAMTYWADMSRGNELVIARANVLRFPSIALHIDEATVGDQLRRACGLSSVELPRAA